MRPRTSSLLPSLPITQSSQQFGSSIAGEQLGIAGVHAQHLEGFVASLVAEAAKIARIAWVVLNWPGAIYERRDPALA